MSVAVPTSASRSPGASGSLPAPRRRTTSQRCGVQRRGSRPLVRRTCDARPSTPARETKRPATVLSRNRTIRVGPGSPRPGEPRADRGVERRVDLLGADGHPKHGANRARGRGGCDRPPERRSGPGDLRAGENSDEHGRPDGDPARREQGTRGAPPHTPPGERDDVERRSRLAAMPAAVGQGVRPCRERRGPVARRPPTRSTRRSARARRVRDDPRVAADLDRPLRMPEEVRVVALLPDEHEVRGGHVLGHEGAARRPGTGTGRSARDQPSIVIGVVVPPELLVLEGCSSSTSREPYSGRLVPRSRQHDNHRRALPRRPRRRGGGPRASCVCRGPRRVGS